MESIQVEPHEDVNGSIDGKYDGAVEKVTDCGAVDGDDPPEGAQGEEEAHSQVCEGQADDVEVEPLIEKSDFRKRQHI